MSGFGDIMVRIAAVGMLAAVLLAATGCLTPLTAQTPLAPLAPVPAPAAPVIGVYAPGSPGSWSGLGEFARATGVTPRIVVYYSPWNDQFSASFAQAAWNHGAYLLVQLQPANVSLAAVAGGGSDSYLRGYAEAVAAFGHPVILSFGHEMNGGWYSWGAGRTRPATFVAAWRHLVQVFRAAGAVNVTWLWAVNTVQGASGSLRQWWPGTEWVSWTAIDGYYFRATDTFSSGFGATIAGIRQFSHAALLIAETAVGTTSDRESQIGGLFAGVRAAHLAGVVWFDEAQHAGLYHQDWRLEDDPAALAVFTSAAATYLRAVPAHA
jgi:mannan endo-1,4-beta-mannosidase